MFFFLIFNFFVKPEEDWLSSMGYSSLKRGVFFFFFSGIARLTIHGSRRAGKNEPIISLTESSEFLDPLLLFLLGPQAATDLTSGPVWGFIW